VTTELTKPVSRRVGDLVVTIENDGIRLRAFRKRRSVFLPWSEAVKRGLVRMVYMRVTGKATMYQTKAIPLCRTCREGERGRWMYAS
jgi:hypothetical protein